MTSSINVRLSGAILCLFGIAVFSWGSWFLPLTLPASVDQTTTRLLLAFPALPAAAILVFSIIALVGDLPPGLILVNRVAGLVGMVILLGVVGQMAVGIGVAGALNPSLPILQASLGPGVLWAIVGYTCIIVGTWTVRRPSSVPPLGQHDQQP